jgi:hypothetical protein
MLKTIMLILFLIFTSTAKSQTITYLKVADKADYELYKKYCNDTIVVEIVQFGKATIVNPKVSGLNFEMYKAMAGGYSDKLLKDTFWYAPWKYGTKTAARTYGTNDYPVQRVVKAKVLRRVYSVDDYYRNRAWMLYK